MKNKILITLLFLGLLALPQLSYADWSFGLHFGTPAAGWHRDGYRDRDDYRDRDYWRWHGHPGWGVRTHWIPAGAVTVWAGGARYYYYDGLYYTYAGGQYVLVQPPIGAYVSVIPPDFRPVVINGRVYYTDNGVYYIKTRWHGYQVVAAPFVYAQPVVQTGVVVRYGR